jgi:hypothetical protein
MEPPTMRDAVFGPVVFTIAVLVSAWSAPTARAFYCDGRIVTRGDRVERVRSICGAPTHEGTETIIVHRTRQVASDHYLTTITARTVDVWTYDFGPGRLREQLLIDGGVVTQVRDLGYGGARPGPEKHEAAATGGPRTPGPRGIAGRGPNARR